MDTFNVYSALDKFPLQAVVSLLLSKQEPKRPQKMMETCFEGTFWQAPTLPAPKL